MKTTPGQYFFRIVTERMLAKKIPHAEATRQIAAEQPDLATLVSAFGRSRRTIIEFNNSLDRGETAAEGKKTPRFVEIVTHGKAAHRGATEFANSAEPKPAPSFVQVVMPGDIGRRAQFDNSTNDACPMVNPRHCALFFLPPNTTQETYAAAFAGNGNTISPVNPAKIFAALVEFTQEQKKADHAAALAQVKTKFPNLWNAVETVSKLPV
jgi:hypothetical protein